MTAALPCHVQLKEMQVFTIQTDQNKINNVRVTIASTFAAQFHVQSIKKLNSCYA